MKKIFTVILFTLLSFTIYGNENDNSDCKVLEGANSFFSLYYIQIIFQREGI